MLARVAAVVGATAAVLSFAVPPASADAATIAGYTPSSAATGATIGVTGSGLTGAKGASFNSANGAVAAASFTVVGDGEVDAVVPASATSGPVTITLSDGSSTVQGPPFTVVPTASLTTSAASVVYPATVELAATLTSGGAGVPNQTGTLQSLVAGSTWTNGQQAVTDASGVAHFTAKPVFTTAYRVVFAATAAYGEAGTNTLTVRQRPQVFLRVPSAAPILTAVRVKGFIWPRQVGRVRLEQYTRGAWRWVASTTSDATGHFVFTINLPAKSTYTYRARRLADSRQLGNVGAAGTVLGVDRTLRYGLSGPDVTALQRRLRALHYDVGGITGTYNFDTQHAVTAFEKIQRMTRDGVVGAAVLKRLATPRIPHLRHPLSGAAIEIDLTRQVLYYAVNGRIVRILDSSTGGGYYYTGSDGSTQRAITPTGHFSIRYKINKWVTSKLGVLYRPAYFNNSGYAIHGEPLVPSYPASHGCVRITVPAMNRMYDKLTYGMSVWIYR